MLTSALVEEVQRLLAEGRLSQRKIAAKLGVSRGSVTRISLGLLAVSQDHPPPEPESREPPESDPAGPTGPPQFCRTCGGMVHMPCRLCHTRAVWAQARSRSASDSVRLWQAGVELPPLEADRDPPWAELAPALSDGPRQRYEELRLLRATRSPSADQLSMGAGEGRGKQVPPAGRDEAQQHVPCEQAAPT